MSAGYNPHDTPIKCRNFRTMLKLQMRVVKEIFAQKSWAAKKGYIYVDCNGGPGVYDREDRELKLSGSPLIFLEEVKQMGLPFQAFIIENDANDFERLIENVSTFLHEKIITRNGKSYYAEGHNITLYRGDNSTAASLAIPKDWQFGVIYHDPNGPPNFPLLRTWAKKFPHTDQIININSNGKKRMDAVQEGTSSDLAKELSTIGKKRYLVTSSLTGKWQWLMALATNADKETIKEWRNEGLIDLDSPDGRQVLLRATHTKKELREMLQMDFFNQPDREMPPTEATGSI